MIRIGAGFLSGSDGNGRCQGAILFRLSIIVVLIFTAVGCASPSRVNKLLTLKGLADEQDTMGKEIAEQDRKFSLMLEEMRAGTLDQYLTQKRIARNFGDPVFVDNISKDGQPVQVWMYRHPAQYFGSEKIYLYFDPDGHLSESEYVEATDGEIR